MNKEMKEDPEHSEFIKTLSRVSTVPTKILVRKTISKGGHSYFTFVTKTGAKKILACPETD